MKKFTIKQKNINLELRRNKSNSVLNIIEILENQAIEILIDSKIIGDEYYNPPFKSDSESWRLFWLNEAHHQCDEFEPTGEAGEHLTKFERAAVNVMMASSSLREAIENNRAFDAAAMAILMISDATIGGIEIDLFETMENLSKATKSKRVAYESGIGKSNNDYEEIKKITINSAKELWLKNSEIRMGDVAKSIINQIKEVKQKFKEIESFPTESTIKKWIKDAADKGALTIPPGAQAPGRRPTAKG